MMLSIPPDLNYRNFHSHQPGQGPAAIDRVAATGCTAIDAYALTGLRASLERRAARSVVVELPSDRRLASRMLAAGVLQDPRVVTRGRRPSRGDRYRGVPITRLSTAGDVDRFAVDVLAAMRVARSLDLSGARLMAAGEASQYSGGFRTIGSTVYQVDDLHPRQVLVMKLAPGEHDDAGSIGEYLVLVRGNGFALLCPYFKDGDPLAASDCG